MAKKTRRTCSDGILRTQTDAEEYAKRLAQLTKKTQHVFAVPEGTAAHAMGYRFATYAEGEEGYPAAVASYDPSGKL